jgi:hypothetical protein
MSLLETLQQHLGTEAVDLIAARIGAEPGATANAVDAALPLLLTALATKSAEPASATALSAIVAEYDGTPLEDIPGFLQEGRDAARGAALLHELLGERAAWVVAAIGEISGLDPMRVCRLLPLLAPIVMAAVARTVRTGNLDVSGLSALLRSEQLQLATAAPGIVGVLRGLLDRKPDRPRTDEPGGILASVFGERR